MRTTLDLVDFLKNQRIVFKSFRGVRTKTTWEFKDIGGKVLITLDFEYEMPAAMNIREDEREALAKTIEDAWGKSLDMLKWVLESRPRDNG